MQMLILMILLMMGRQADGQMSIREDAEGNIDAAAYAAEYADADAVTVSVHIHQCQHVEYFTESPD